MGASCPGSRPTCPCRSRREASSRTCFRPPDRGSLEFRPGSLASAAGGELDSESHAAGVLLSEDARREMEAAIVAAPDVAPIVRGTGGIRKLRWAGSGPGKRGGIRAIYFWCAAPGAVYMLTAYAKTDRDDLTAADRKGDARRCRRRPGRSPFDGLRFALFWRILAACSPRPALLLQGSQVRHIAIESTPNTLGGTCSSVALPCSTSRGAVSDDCAPRAPTTLLRDTAPQAAARAVGSPE